MAVDTTSGSIPGVARGKVTITLDRDKAEKAMRLSGRQTVSGVIDAALDEYIRTTRNQRDAEIYERMPITEDEFPGDYAGGKLDLGDDDVDYEALYGFRDLAAGDRRSDARRCRRGVTSGSRTCPRTSAVRYWC